MEGVQPGADAPKFKMTTIKEGYMRHIPKEHKFRLSRQDSQLSYINRNIFDNCIEMEIKKACTSRLFGSSWMLATLRNERGMALVMALVLGVVGMLMLASVLYMVKTGTDTGSSQRYSEQASTSAHGVMTLVTREIIQNALAGAPLSGMGATYNQANMTLALGAGSTNATFTSKLTTSGWIGNGIGYPGTDPDAIITLTFPGVSPDIVVNATLRATSRGNSGTSTNVLVGGGVVSSGGGSVITPEHVPYMYHVDIQAQSATSSGENARLSGIYAY